MELTLHVSADGPLVAIGVDDHPPLRLRRGETPVPIAHALVERRVEVLEAVPLALRPPTRAREPLVDRDVEEEGAVRHEIAARERGDGTDVVEWDAVAVALIGHRRVEEAVGDYRLAH